MPRLRGRDKPSRSDNRINVAIVPFGDIDLSTLRVLTGRLQRLMGVQVEMVDAARIPDNSFAPSRDQFLAEHFLSSLRKIVLQDCHMRVIGVTDKDLFAPGLNFVFGQALDRAAVISTRRLRPSEDTEEGNTLFQTRIVKEAVHELGHTLGLGHCPDPFCVMHFSNSIKDTDLKNEKFCGNCSAKAGSKIGREV